MGSEFSFYKCSCVSLCVDLNKRKLRTYICICRKSILNLRLDETKKIWAGTSQILLVNKDNNFTEDKCENDDRENGFVEYRYILC